MKPGTGKEASETRLHTEESDVYRFLPLHKEAADCARAEEELSMERKRFQILEEHAPFGTVIIDKNGSFRYINRKFRELFGYDASEIPSGREWFRKAYPDPAYRRKAIEAWIDDDRVLACGEKSPRIFRVACKDGTEKIVRFIFVKLDGQESLLTCEDITESKRLEQDLLTAHQQLQDIIEFLPDATFVIDKEKKVIAWNRAIEELTGVGKKDIIGKGDYAYGAPFYGHPRPILIDLIYTYNEEIRAQYHYLERKGDTLYGETYTVHLPGREKVILWAKASPLLDNEGRVAGAIESIRDITDRKRSEEALGDANEKLAALIRASPLAILAFDPQGLVQTWNASAERIFGWKEEEVIGRFPPLVPEDRRQEFRALIEIAMQGKMYTGVELQRMRKDGSTIDVSLSSAPIRDGAGRIRGIMSVMDDISKKKAIERSLRENLHLLQRLIDTIPNPIYYKNRDGHFLGCNLAFERFVSLSKEEIIGKMVDDIYSREQAELCSASDAALFREPGIRIEETSILLRDGRRVDVISNKATYANEDGTLAGLVEVIIDITERKQSEAELLAAKEAAEEAARVKADFLANMSHEIRTPLNAVIGMTGLLLDAGLSPENRDCVETIRSSSDTLLAIINDILDFSKLEGGKMELERQPFDLCACIEESLDLVAAAAADKGLNLAYLVDERTPLIIMGDLTRSRQILVNLLSNAVKFTEAGEVIVSVASRCLVDDYYELQFSIKDTGIGISYPQMGRLFQSFSQIDASTSRKYGGTGLGLAISRRLVELMGGRIWAESEPGRGSTFNFTIIAETMANQPKPHQLPDQPLLAGKRLLIMDGSQTNLKIMESLSRFWGMQPFLANDDSEALDLIRSEIFDLAILGTGGEGVDLVVLASEIREYQKHLPVILYTSFARKLREDCNHFNATLSRPIKPAGLYQAILGIFGEKAMPDLGLMGEEPEPGHHLRILLAEDNVVNQKVALKMLKKMGYRADLAANGLEVLQALERLPYDVVLMDVQMPEMDGLEAARRIRERWPAGPKIIAITAYALDGDRERCLDAGMNDYISKPVSMQELAEALNKCRPLARGLSPTAGRRYDSKYV